MIHFGSGSITRMYNGGIDATGLPEMKSSSIAESREMSPSHLTPSLDLCFIPLWRRRCVVVVPVVVHGMPLAGLLLSASCSALVSLVCRHVLG